MTAKEVFELRNIGNVKGAYMAARQLYATDKSPYSRIAMFWTAVDMFRLDIKERQYAEAEKILLALERLQPSVPDKDGWIADATRRCREQMESTRTSPSEERMQAEHSLMGKWGEKVAADYLYRKGYEILEQDWHSTHRDIDIIAQRGPMVVFVEVKTRRNREYGNPLNAINRKKRYHLRRAITHYIKFHRIENYRFDIITIVGPMNSPTPEITHIEDVNLIELE